VEGANLLKFLRAGDPTEGNLMYNMPLKKDYAVYFQLKVLIQNKRNA
jgi:hypothetical protein